jgi:hypothetical protein
LEVGAVGQSFAADGNPEVQGDRDRCTSQDPVLLRTQRMNR